MSTASALRHEAPEQAGRSCPLSYRYSPAVFDRAPQIRAETLYVVGGLYGNVEALDGLESLVASEGRGTAIVFNGDFHWFDVAAGDFRRIEDVVMRHGAIRGNVETEIADEESAAGCGCAYPSEVSDAEVERSNAILERLRETAHAFPEARRRVASLDMHLVAEVGGARVGIAHGDAASLSGWGFAHDRLDDPRQRPWIDSVFRDSRVDVFATSHTCLPALRAFDLDGRTGIIANNGAAGMPNFRGRRHGIVTRIALAPFAGSQRLYGTTVRGVHIEAIALDYDHDAWVRRFLASWPAGSSGHVSYYRRIIEGPSFNLESAKPSAV